MHDPSSQRSSRAARPGIEQPLQPDEGDDAASEAVPPAWLVEFSQSLEATQVKRLENDAEVLLQLQLAGYGGARWDYFAGVLAEYAYAVLRSWLRRRVIVQRCREKRVRRGLPREADLDAMREDAEELAGETAAEALVSFRERVLKRHVWDPRKGASLASFFVGHCLIRFPDVYDRWRRERERSPWPLRHPEHTPLRPDAFEPQEAVLDRVEIREHAAELDARTFRVLQLHAAGYTHAEIAQHLGPRVTPKVVETILYRHRKRMRKGA